MCKIVCEDISLEYPSLKMKAQVYSPARNGDISESETVRCDLKRPFVGVVSVEMLNVGIEFPISVSLKYLLGDVHSSYLCLL